jgi:dihydroflavonol-4-reductase
MRTAVTGAGGFLGGALVRTLLARGHSVRACLNRTTRGVDGLPVERARAPLEDPRALRRAFDGIELVFHAAGRVSLLGGERALQAANVDGTRQVVEACRAAGVRRLLHVSSIETLLPSRPLGQPVDEAAPPPPEEVRNVYGRSKARAERVVLESVAAGLDAVLVNPTAMVGPEDHGLSASGRLVRDLALGRVPALTPGGFDWVDVRSVAAGCLAAAERGRRGERYLLGGELVRLTELARWVTEETGQRAPRLVLPGWLARLAACLTPIYYGVSGGEPRFTRMSVDLVLAEHTCEHRKAEAELGYRPGSTRQAVVDTVRWLREAGHLPARA